MTISWMFLSILAIVGAFTFTSPPELAGLTFPHYVHLSHTYIFDNRADFWNMTYDIVPIGDGCTPPSVPASELEGKILLVNPTERDSPCRVCDVTSNFNGARPAAYLFFDYYTYGNWGSFNPYCLPSNDVPVLYTGWVDPYVNTFTDYANCAACMMLAYPENQTVVLDHPTQSPYMHALHFPSAAEGVTRWLVTSLSLISMFLCVSKLTSLIELEGVCRSLPQGTVALLFLASLVEFIHICILGGCGNIQAVAPYDFYEGGELVPLALFFSALILFGIYLQKMFLFWKANEVSRVGSALRILTIPLMVFFVVNLAIMITIGFVDSGDPWLQNLDTVSLPNLFLFEFSWVSVIAPFFLSALLLWGTINIFRVWHAGEKPAVFWMGFTAIVIILDLWTVLLVWGFLFFVPVDMFSIQGNIWGMTVMRLWWTRDLTYGLGILVPSIMLVFVFRVSVEKARIMPLKHSAGIELTPTNSDFQ